MQARRLQLSEMEPKHVTDPLYMLILDELFIRPNRVFVPDLLRLPSWRLRDHDGYVRAVEAKLRARGFCAHVENGDILKVKSVAKGNLFHEEIDVVQNPPGGGSYLLYAIKDRCHNAGF
jgi:hypothetical protein